MTGDQDQIQRESDNGEPQGTAGVPILEVLKANKIHDVLAIVIRYFGGIKLGAGGLIRAYSSSCAQAIEAVGIVKRIIKTKVTITIEYPLWGKLQNFLTNEKLLCLTRFTPTRFKPSSVSIPTSLVISNKRSWICLPEIACLKQEQMF